MIEMEGSPHGVGCNKDYVLKCSLNQKEKEDWDAKRSIKLFRMGKYIERVIMEGTTKIKANMQAIAPRNLSIYNSKTECDNNLEIQKLQSFPLEVSLAEQSIKGHTKVPN